MEAMQRKLEELSTQVTDLDLKYEASETERKILEEKVKEAETLAAEAAAQGAPGSGTDAKGSSIDTRGLGKPEAFHGENKKWPEWKLVASAFLRCLHKRLGPLMKQAENLEEVVDNAALAPSDRIASEQLYFALLMLMKGTPLTTLSNAGEGEGLSAWRAFCKKYDESSKDHWVARLRNILNFDMHGDIDERLDEFDKQVSKYKKTSGDDLKDPMKIGIIMNRMPEGPLKIHLNLHVLKYTAYEVLRKDIVDITRARQLPEDMDVDGMEDEDEDLDGLKGKGPKGRGRGKGGKTRGGDKTDKTCNYCKKPGHLKADCRKFAADQKKGGVSMGGQGGG